MKTSLIHTALTCFTVLACISAGAQTGTYAGKKPAQQGIANDASVFTIVEEMPEYPGGIAEMMKFIQKEVRFPKKELADSSFTGCKSFLRMVIDTSGRVTDPLIIRGCTGCPECDAEALRVVKAMPLWKAGRQNGKKVKVYYTLPINYRKN